MVLTSLSPERTSSSLISIRPSRRSVYRSVMRQDTRARWEFTHLVNVFFCTASRSSVSKGELTLPPTQHWQQQVQDSKAPQPTQQECVSKTKLQQNPHLALYCLGILGQPLHKSTSRLAVSRIQQMVVWASINLTTELLVMYPPSIPPKGVWSEPHCTQKGPGIETAGNCFP